MKPRFLTLTGIVLLAALSRFLPHPPNVAPIMAIALFGGTYFEKRPALAVPLAALLLSDLLLGFHRLMPIIYLCFMAMVLIGRWISKNKSAPRIAVAALASSFGFFVVTNFGVWAFESLYPKTWAGLVACYVAAIPFLQNSLAGDAAYTLILFGGLALAERLVPSLQKPQLAVGV